MDMWQTMVDYMKAGTLSMQAETERREQRNAERQADYDRQHAKWLADNERLRAEFDAVSLDNSKAAAVAAAHSAKPIPDHTAAATNHFSAIDAAAAADATVATAGNSAAAVAAMSTTGNDAADMPTATAAQAAAASHAAAVAEKYRRVLVEISAMAAARRACGATNDGPPAAPAANDADIAAGTAHTTYGIQLSEKERLAFIKLCQTRMDSMSQKHAIDLTPPTATSAIAPILQPLHHITPNLGTTLVKNETKEKKTPTSFATFNSVQRRGSRGKPSTNQPPLADATGAPAPVVPPIIMMSTSCCVALAVTDLWPDNPSTAPPWWNTQQDVDDPAAAPPEPDTALPATNVITPAPRCHPAHRKSVPPGPPPTSCVTYSEIYLHGGVVSPALLPLQQAPTRRVPPLPTQSVFNLTPNSIYYTDGSVASHIKYEALVFYFLFSELVSS